MIFKDDAELVARVAAAAVTATLAATGGRGLMPPKTPTTPKVPVRPTLAPAKPVRPTHPTRTASVTASSRVDRDRLALAVHEAGHAVAGVVLGAELRNAYLVPENIKMPDGRKGEARFGARPHGTDEQIVYAGPWAQAKFAAGGRRPTQREFYAVMATSGVHDDRVLTAAGGIHEGAGAQPIIDHCWDAVLTVAKTLYNVGEVHEEDVLNALGVNTHRPIGSQLSSIRSGAQAVPARCV